MKPIHMLASGAFLVAVFLPVRALAVFGVADTSFVTVVANPAEAANWMSQLRALEGQLSLMRTTMQEIQVLQAYAGDPARAVQLRTGIPGLMAADRALFGGEQTVAQLEAAGRAAGAGDLSLALGAAGISASVTVNGQPVARDLSAYLQPAQDGQTTAALRSQLAAEQAARQLGSLDLSAAWADFQAAASESQKQAALTRISAIEASDRLRSERRRAMLDDLALADRGAATQHVLGTVAAEQDATLKGAALRTAAAARVQAADADRQSVLGETPAATPGVDYTGLKLWTPAEAGPAGS